MEYEIEKGIPLPARRYGARRKNHYPFDLMDFGDSFLAPIHEKKKLMNAVWLFKKKNKDHEFVVRETDGKLRVWRLPPPGEL